MTSLPSPSRAVRVLLGLVGALLIGSCGRESPLPLSNGVSLARHGLFSVEPVFPRLVGGKSLEDVVQFEKVRIVLRRADGSVALDTTVLFPVGVDTVVLAASVPLSPASGTSGENFKLDLGYMNAAGEVVFKGGPVDLTVVPKGSSTPAPAPVQIPITYSGPGSTARNVVVSPRSVAVTEGGAFAFTAVAIDAAGNVIPNTPIVWATPDPTRVVLNSSTAGDGHALAVRGTARIYAQLLTGPMDTVTVNVTLLPRTLALLSGDAQRGIVGTVLAQPIAVKVTAGDGAGVSGVTVAFAPTAGSGTVANASVTTDANGVAQTTWTLGPRGGEHNVTASVAGLSGSPVTFRATARSVAPVKLEVTTQPPASNVAGGKLPLVVTAYDAQGDVAKTFTGTVTVALGAGSPAVPLLGSLSATAVEGVATFADVRINRPGTGFSLAASATGLTGATTGTFAVVPGPAHRLEFAEYPVNGAVAGNLGLVVVIARDEVGNIATSFGGTVTLALLDGGADRLGGTLTRVASNGTARFDDLTLLYVGDYRIGAASPGVTAVAGSTFWIRSGPASRLYIVSGRDQTALVNTQLTDAVMVNIADQYGNPVAQSGVSIAFSASHGGSTTPASATTNANGFASARWTLGGTAGVQTLTVSSTALGTASVTAVATSPLVTSGGGGDLIVLEDWNWGTNDHGLTGNGSVYPGNVQFIKNLVNFTPSGSRASATKVISLLDRPIYPSLSTNFSVLASIVQGQGLTAVEASSHSVLTPVASDVKVILLVAPGYSFTTSEINGLKTFASQGGRIVFIGENSGTYPYQESIENPFLIAMGAAARSQSSPSCLAQGVIVTTAAHSVTTGITASGSGGFYMNCTSYLTGLGASDATLFTSGSYILGAAVSFSLTPLGPAAAMAPAQLRSGAEVTEIGVLRGRADGAAGVRPRSP
jgi:hypothetical protein